MRVAIISDIHSNLEALTKAMEIIDQKSVDSVICLGDIVGYGANPNECIEIVRQRCSMVIKGNHDDAIGNPKLVGNFNASARDALYWTVEQLTRESSEYLKTLPLTCKMNDLLFVHASPCEPADWRYILNENSAAPAFKCFSEQICFIGHSHTPKIYSNSNSFFEVGRDDRFIVNTGSIGQPRDRNPDLSFGLFDTDKWKYENIRAPYDIENAVLKILRSDLPPGLGHRLLIGM